VPRTLTWRAYCLACEWTRTQRSDETNVVVDRAAEKHSKAPGHSTVSGHGGPERETAREGEAET
jgi:hypothetical protein